MSKVMVRDRKNETGLTRLVLIYQCNSSNPSGYKIDFPAPNSFRLFRIARISSPFAFFPATTAWSYNPDSINAPP